MLHALTVIVPAAEADALYEALEQAGAIGLLLEDADEGSADESPLFGEPSDIPADEPRYWPRTRIKAFFDTWSVSAHSALPLLGARRYELEAVGADDWVAKTQAQFQPIEITDSLWIVPSWHRDNPGVDIPGKALRIELDPGLAFGTGSHPTTRLCLQWLAAHPPLAASVLDYGCGSGILAIAALKLDAASVTGVDIDPQAVISARENALRNHGAQIRFDTPDALSSISTTFDIVIANILSNPLKVLAALLSKRAGKTLVLSGILARQADEIAAAYAPYIAMKIWRTDDDWVCMVGHHRQPA
jgi:ribosomal protein L11 methyltransferase